MKSASAAAHKGIGCGDSLVGIPASPEVAPEPIEGALAALVDADPALYEDQGLYNALAESNLTLDEVSLTFLVLEEQMLVADLPLHLQQLSSDQWEELAFLLSSLRQSQLNSSLH